MTSSSSSLPSSSSNSLNQQPSSNSTRQQSNNNPASNAPFNDATHSNNGAIVPARQIQLTDMPVEIFEKIFFYTGYKEVSNMRLVKKITTTTTIKPLNQNSRKISITIIFSDCAVVVQFSFNDMKMHTTQIVSHSFHIILLIFEKNPYLCPCFLSLSFCHTHIQVSTQTNQICKTILNSTFTKLQTQLMKRFQNIKKIMPRR